MYDFQVIAEADIKENLLYAIPWLTL